MSGIILKAKNLQPSNFKSQGVPFILREGDNSIKIEDWLVIKNIVEKKISAGFVFIDRNEEFQAIELFRKGCFAEFEQLGMPAVKTSIKNGELSKGVKHSFALEWLSSKEESREESRDNREIESLSIARKSKNIAICAIVISTITALLVSILSVWLTIKFAA
ncbi:hypothetical protein OAP63_02925 [Vibrio sp.]|nr:hypothetical protein [Vibrio sp.]